VAWTEAHAQLVSIVCGTTPTTKKAGSGAKFTHDSDGRREAPPDTRGFFFEPKSAAMTALFTIPGERWLRIDLELLVAYRDVKDRATFFEIILADYLALMKRLGDAGTWGQPASTIQTLMLGDELMGRMEIEDFPDGGGVFAVIHFQLEFKE
jgi:hypothetical protein